MKHVFFLFVGLGNLKISGRFRATPTWSSWHSLPGRKLQGPRSTRESTDLPSSFRVPSEFLPKVDQLSPSQGNSTNLTPRLASLLAILPWTRHLCRPCHIASNSQPLPAQNCTSESESSKRHGHMKLGPVLSLSGLNFLEMLYQFILRGAVMLQLAVKKLKKSVKIIEIQKSRKRQQHQAYFNKNTPGNFAKHGTNPKP